MRLHEAGRNDRRGKVHLLIDWIRNTQKELRIPRAIRFYGKDALPTEQGFIPEAVFEERLPQIAKDALLDACTSSNPRKPTESEMKKLLQACYYDRDIDFEANGAPFRCIKSSSPP